MAAKYNLNNPSIKRIMQEVREMQREETSQYTAAPLEDDLFEWHFTIRGPRETEFEKGIYHGRILLPPEYPFKPPNIILLTPNGRFEVGKKICLSISAHHPEHWQPSWSIRTVLVALIGFMPTKGGGAIAALDYPAEERRILAKKSVDWSCERCGAKMSTTLPPEDPNEDLSSAQAQLPAELSPLNASQNGPITTTSSSEKEKEDSQNNSSTPSSAQQSLEESQETPKTETPSSPSPPAPPSIPEVSSQGPPPNTTTTTIQQATVAQPSDQDKMLNSAIFALLFFVLALVLRKMFSSPNQLSTI